MARKKANPITAYLAYLSIKYNIFLSELFEALGAARRLGKVNCQEITIEYRGCVKNQAIFLVTKGTTIVGQFKVLEDFLGQENICFEKWMATDKIRRQIEKQKRKANPKQVQDLRAGMKKVFLEAKVLETKMPSRIYTQFGHSATLTNALIGDETGNVRLCLWNNQASLVSAGDRIRIRNATVSTYKGERQLRLGKGATVQVLAPLFNKSESA